MVNQGGDLWRAMNNRPKLVAATLSSNDVPTAPGVYAWYVGINAMYVGKGKSLRKRILRNHHNGGNAMSGSAFRRNVAEMLGYGTPSKIKSGETTISALEMQSIKEWISACNVAWIECDTEAEALDLEAKMKQEFTPPLTKR